MKKINSIVKRIFDFFAALIGIIILSPIFIIVSIAIKLDSPGNIMFLQKRVGKCGKEFDIFKFRTMVTNAERLGKQITVGKDNRITKVGAFLRKYKIDELPQLFNVLKGDMSLVGPRPEVPKYVALYNEEQKKVLSVRPGITDLASLKYSDENDILGKVENPEEYYINVIMKDKLSLNLEYIEKSNLFFDISLVIKTILKCI
ncbi:sugar transferase [Clostridium saudiense]|uniref:sugar transferase n=1 Tax=Clostridium saudiense TaxID=1414720 RepID=UPI00082050C3|nr:sugar transferase [Clostridium saudiense]MDU7453375.1 sugar transferase [Clostridium saudiense]SCJ84219.1 Putative colanic biosynthesis UDP-glucose lipid carrier transferase [uncultured Clostridium sp.]